MSNVIEISGNDLRRLQRIELEMLIEVDRICRKCGIKYSLCGGTLLGAVRHKGFIPWDDDLDVMFSHEEYERFFNACKTELDGERFFLQDFRTDSNYRWGYAKLRRKNTEYIKKGQEHLKQQTGVCIDLFDFQNVPLEEKERSQYHFKMFCIRKILYSELGRKNEKKAIMRCWYSILSLIPTELVHSCRYRLIEKYKGIKPEYMSCEMFPIEKSRDGYLSSVFENYTWLEFEGRKFMAVAEWDRYLSTQYGDYMSLPPVEQRCGVMDAVEYKLIDVEV